MVKELYLARHGETIWNAEKIIQGWKDSPLTWKGISQARALGSYLKDEGIEFILCGDLERQRWTAAEILSSFQVPVSIVFTPLLRERSAGIQEGVAYADLDIREETDFNFYTGDGTGAFATAEPLKKVVARAQAVLDIIFTISGQRFLTIGSGWINSYITNLLLGEPWVYREQENATAHYFKCGDAGGVIEFELHEKMRKNNRIIKQS